MAPTNWLALIVSALIPMVLGFIWYNPKVFGTAWMQASGMTEEKAKGANMPVVFGLSFVLSILLAFAMNIFARHEPFVENSVMNQPGFGDPNSEVGQWLTMYFTNWSGGFRTFSHGLAHGIIAAIIVVLPVFGTNALFERKSFKYVAINVGYWIVTLGLMGGIICAWQ